MARTQRARRVEVPDSSLLSPGPFDLVARFSSYRLKKPSLEMTTDGVSLAEGVSAKLPFAAVRRRSVPRQ